MPDLHEDEPAAGPLALAGTDDRLLWLLNAAGNEWGPMGVALTAALVSDPDAVVANLVLAGSAKPIGRKRAAAMRARRGLPARPIGRVEVVEDAHGVRGVPVQTEEERLRAQLASVIAERDRVRDARVEVEAERDDYRQRLGLLDADLARHRAEWDQRSAEGRRQVERLVASNDDLRGQVTHLTDERDEARSQLVTHAREAEQLAEGLRAERDALREQLREYRASFDPAVEEASPHPIAEDPRRPRLDHFPDDAILLTYRELRQLVGLHLEACATSVAPSDSARAMRDGETGLRLAEVLDR